MKTIMAIEKREDVSPEEDLIMVCAACLQSSCWQGIFMCQESQTANIRQMTRRELKRLNREHPSYWKTDKELCER